ncbi:MAG: hypothetical protein HW416_2523 [Chloroflexi bacterium]|nr:hypothetical protein [Chloroflexota bacterium]
MRRSHGTRPQRRLSSSEALPAACWPTRGKGRGACAGGADHVEIPTDDWAALLAGDRLRGASALSDAPTIGPDEIRLILNLQPHPTEGGFFTETFRSAEIIPGDLLPLRFTGERAFSTSIYYLLTQGNVSPIHRVAADEVFHFYLGDPVEMLQLAPDGSAAHVVTLGTDLARSMRPQVLVPHGTWEGSRLVPGGHFALLGVTVAPGFDYADFELGDRAALAEAYPAYRGLIASLTQE